MRVLRVAFTAAFAACAYVSSASAQSPVQSPIQSAPKTDDNVLMFVGTYSRDEGWVNGTGKGVHVFQFNTRDGGLTPVGAKAFGFNPTFLAGLKNRRVVYAVNEVNDESVLKPGVKTGYVYALSVDAAGTLTELNHVESGGGSATHVSVSPDEDFVTVSNYNGGSVSIFPINADGSLKQASDFYQYTGGSKVVAAQDGSHMHSMTWVGKGSTGVFGADLGNDRVAQYNVDKKTGKLVKNAKNEFITRPPGSGPRHMAIHPSKKYAYVLGELGNTIGVYNLNAATGSLATTATQLISTLPADFTEWSASADIHTSDCGKFLYSSNRGHNSIAIFKIGAKGQLTLLGHESTRGKTPRNFHIYKNFMIVANQDTNNIEVFRINQNTGLLTYTNKSAECGTPVNVFIPRY